MRTFSVFCCLLYAAGIEASIKVEAFEGEDVSFECSHKYARTFQKYLCRNPCKDQEDVLVTVQAGGRAASASGRITLVDSGNGVFTVTFSRIQLADVGQYWCGVERLGFDTFTKVQVTVKEAQLTTPNEAVARDTTEAIRDFSPTWTYPGMSLSTELPPGTDTRWPANLSTGPVVFATVGTVALLAILMLAITVRKCRKIPQPEPRVGSNGPTSAEEGEDDCEYDGIGEDVQSMKTTSELFSSSPSPKPNPATAVKCSEPLHTYENCRRYSSNKDSRVSAANVHGPHDVSSSVKPLPHISERIYLNWQRK